MKHRKIRAILALLTLLPLLAACFGAQAEKTLLLTFTGDCTLGGQEKTRQLPDSFDTIAAQEGYAYFLANFKELFTNDDLTVINLEGVLSDSHFQQAAKKYRFRGKTDFVKILTGCSVEAASLSNNHIGDYGKKGEASTKNTLDEHHILWFQGTKKYALFQKNGVTIALFALDNTIVYNTFDKFKKMIREVRASGEANAVIVCWHTGREYIAYHEKKTENTANELIDCGVDLIIINHSHCAQGMSIHNNRCVFYSLGNFVFGGNSIIRAGRNSKDPLAISLYGELVQVRMTFSDDGKYMGQQVTVHPVYSSGTNPANNYQPKRLTMEEAAPIYEAMQRDTTFELPPMTEKDGFARIEFNYLPAFDEPMIPEDSEAESGPQGMPEASSPTPTRENKGN